jgi:hypothetical protein
MPVAESHLPQGSRNAQRVDAAVLIEPFVFGGQDRAADLRRDVYEIRDLELLAGDADQKLAV